MNNLYISDLDGTLLNSKAEVTDHTAELINALIKKGMNFTFATARSVYSAKPMTAKLDINAPCILMNGVSVYDLKTDKYIKNEYIPEPASSDIIKVFEQHNMHCFMYKIHNDVLTAYFTDMTTEVMQKFAEERKNKFRKPFVQCGSFMEVIDGEIVYFTTTGEYEELFPVREDITHIPGIDCAFYEDTYTKKYYLEIFSDRASKANGIKFLRKNFGFDHVTAFGDNLNDLSMFKESDVSVAVGNAKDEVKESADHIAHSNDENGVAEWLYFMSGEKL